MRKKKKWAYFCFADMEFTCNRCQEAGYDRNYEQEILSIGLVFVNRKTGAIEKEFYSTMRPLHNHKLTEDCKKLTGLTQEEIDRSKSFVEVMREILRLEYSYDNVYVFGNDHGVFKNEMKLHEDVEYYPGIAEFCDKITNVENDLSRKVFGSYIGIGLGGYKRLLELEEAVAHHALLDARDLYYVWDGVQKSSYKEEIRNQIMKEYKDREKYYAARKFHTKSIPDDFIKEDAELARRQAESLVAMIQKANKDQTINPVTLRAFCDDLLKLVGMEPKEAMTCTSLPNVLP